MLLRVLLRLALLGFVLWTALVAFVCVKEYTVPKPDGTTQAIIVLGAQVKPDGYPEPAIAVSHGIGIGAVPCASAGHCRVRRAGWQ